MSLEGKTPSILSGVVDRRTMLAMGTSKLFSVGDAEDKVAKKIEQLRTNPETMKVLTALELNHIPIARKIALSTEFMQRNPYFVLSGQAIKLAVEKGMGDFANELLNAGYVVPPSILIDAIREHSETMIRNVVEGHFYKREDQMELDFWYLNFRGWERYAAMMWDQEPALQQIVPDLLDSKALLVNDALISKAMQIALKRGHDDIASVMLGINPRAITAEMVTIALERNDLEFLKKVWTGNSELRDGTNDKKRKRSSVIWSNLSQKSSNEQKIEVNRYLKITFILEKLLEKKRIPEARRILEWPGACDEDGVLGVCMHFKEEDLAREVMLKRKQGMSSKDLQNALEGMHLKLALDLLKWKECRVLLNKLEAQQTLISLLEDGTSCYYAAEMISWISNRDWHLQLTKDLCETLIFFTKKTDQIRSSHFPLLFITLCAEFLMRLSEVSVEHTNRCISTVETLLEFGKEFEDNIGEEDELKYFLTQTDTRTRTVLTIISQNRFYSLLENDDVGSIVSKLWIGDKKNFGILPASTIVSSCESPIGSEESLAFMKRMDKAKPYMFQFDQWTESCSLRFMSQAVSTLILVIIYTVMVHVATQADVLDDVSKNSDSLVLLRISQVWMSGIFLEQILHIIFGLRTGRGYFFDGWKLVDFAMFCQMLILMLEFNKRLMGSGNLLSSLNPTKFNTIQHGGQLFLIWLRLLSVLITTKNLGPLLRMMYLMMQDMLRFLVIFFALLMGSSAIFTALFEDKTSDDSFISFSQSLQSLFSASLGAFNLDIFVSNRKVEVYIGELLLALFLLFSLVLLLNLLIAILSNVYNNLADRVDSEYRAVLIAYYNKWYWNDSYGILILMPSPFTLAVAAISPIILFSQSPARWNSFFCKFFYVFYVIPQFALFLAGSILYIVPAYFRSFISYGKTGFKETEQVSLLKNRPIEEDDLQIDDEDTMEIEKSKLRTFSYKKSFVWLFVGIPFLLLAYFRDALDFWKLIFKDLNEMQESSELTRVQSMINERFIRNIHKVLKRSENVDFMTVAQFLDALIAEDSNQLNPALADNPEAIHSRHRLFNEYLNQLSNSSKDPTIDLKLVSHLLPRQSYYSQSYLARAMHINIPWISKAIKRFHRNQGSINIKGTLLPKSLVTGETAELKQLDYSFKKVQCDYFDLVTQLKGMAGDMYNLTEELKQLAN